MAPRGLIALAQAGEQVASDAGDAATSDLVEAAASPFSEEKLLAHLVASAALLAGLLLVRWAARRALSRADWKDDAARARTQSHVGTLSWLALVLGLLVIWAPELHAFALSAVALAAALVLATKELILCLSGAFLRATSGAYDLGDRIELGGVRGDVVRLGLLSTTVLEVGPAHQRTGRTLVLPNSLLLSSSVANETHTDEYVLHTFVVPCARDADWRAQEARLLEHAHAACAPWIEPMRLRMERLAREQGLAAPRTDPQVSLQLPEPGRVNLLVRIPAPARQKARVEQQILRAFLGAAPEPEREPG